MSESSTIATLPAVTCAPWCTDGAGHVKAWHPEDQYCIGERQDVELTAMPLLTFQGELEDRARDTFGAYLLRERDSIATAVELVHDDAPVAKLTPAEAIELGRLLVRIGEAAYK